ncbi:heme-thiolate peroxidase aromatic peroxygenase protein [Stemphylium lycopersici]|uniref:Heme-thiolate peroxidase aromatic peroxygenase protein n=1 Tax=Stemphylium lycopersici TaxID=183478 RepID=A0A364NBW9_STELY|nr:heme-thiolate peroxidase aromatic peroxygenase protein [Stemphylium lycopersici]
MPFKFDSDISIDASLSSLRTQMQWCKNYLQRSMVNIDFDGTAVSYLPHNIIDELATFETIWALLQMQVAAGQRIPFVTNIPFASDPVLERISPEGEYRVPWYDPNGWYMMRVYNHEYYELEDVAKAHIQGCFFYEEKVYWVYIRENKVVNDDAMPGGYNPGEKKKENQSIMPTMGPVSRT